MKKWYNRHTMLPQKPVVDDFWTQDIPLFHGVFTYYRNKPQPVRGKVHLAEERYFEKHEIIPMTTSKGIQTYVMLHPYVFEPKLTLTVGLYHKPKQVADMGEQVGEVVSSKQEEVREVEIGNCQAWYYHQDRILVLWECFLESFVRDQPLLQDPNMKLLWQSVETFLLAQFPQAKQVVTPMTIHSFQHMSIKPFSVPSATRVWRRPPLASGSHSFFILSRLPHWTGVRKEQPTSTKGLN